MNLDVFQKKIGITINTTKTIKPFVCQFCNNSYSKESTLSVHSCEQKRRHLAKTEKHVQVGFQAYIRFFQLTQNKKLTKTYEEFAKSQYYNAFVKFGSFIINVNPLYPDRYIDFIVTSGIKLDKWCNEDNYYSYVLDLIKKEPVEVALKRSIQTMITWAEKNDSTWNHYFRYASLNRAVYDIKDGKISPWLILNCDTGRDMLLKFNDEQLSIIFNVMDPAYWSLRFKKHPSDIELVKTVVEEGNI